MQLFKSPGVVTDPVQFQEVATFLKPIQAGLGTVLFNQVDPSIVAGAGTIYSKISLGNQELFYFDSAGNAVQITVGGIVNATGFAGTLDVIADGAIYGKVKLTSLTTGEVTKLTDAGGDDLTINCLGFDRVLTMSGNCALDQSLTTLDSPTFGGLTLTGFTGVLYAAAGIVAAGTMDNVGDGVTYGKIKLASLTSGDPNRLVDAGGEFLTIALGGSNRVLTLGSDVSIDQDLQTVDSPEFATLLLSVDLILGEQVADPGLTINAGHLYTKDDSGVTELYYLEDDGTVVQITKAGAVYATTFSGTLDDVADGVTYARVLATSLSANEVTKLTDSFGDDLTIALGGVDRVLTMNANISLNQDLQTTDGVTFDSLTTTTDINCGRDASVGRDLTVTRNVFIGGGYGTTGVTILDSGDIYADGDVQLADTTGYYIGDKNTDGSWRIIRSGNNLVIERRETGSYITKSTILA